MLTQSPRSGNLTRSALTKDPNPSGPSLVGLAALLSLSLLIRPAAAKVPEGFTETPVASGQIASPTSMAFAPDGRLFVCQQNGQLRVIKEGLLLATPFLKVTVNSEGERGLLGVAFDPGFTTNRFVYIYYTATTPTLHNRVSRFTAQGDTAVAGSERVLLELDDLFASNHNGGCLRFGRDGKLYIATGDNARSENSQSLANLLGKILRLNPDGTLPTDNPFYLRASGKNRAIWALGLRNPFTFAVQPGSGRMMINDVGQGAWEEINLGKAGANYGWPACEGDCNPGNSSFLDPELAYGHGAGVDIGYAIAGGVFYNPATPTFPARYHGRYFFADYGTSWIRVMDPDQPGTSEYFGGGFGNPVDLQVGPDGGLYYLSRGEGMAIAIRYSQEQPPSIVREPADLVVSLGKPATFGVVASGTGPLEYQWERGSVPIPGATLANLTLPAVTAADDGASFRCVVRNPYGTATSQAATLRLTVNLPPVGAILAPLPTQRFQAGETIRFSGTASDAEDGILPASAFRWTVVFHHDTHTHPFLGPLTGVTSGSIVIPTEGETAANVWYRIHLTVTDSQGASTTQFRDVHPRTSRLTLASSPPGLTLNLDGQPTLAPATITHVVGLRRSVSAPAEQYLGGVRYRFVSWSDAGAATHDFFAPATDTTLTARYQANRPPIAQDDAYSASADAPFTVPAPGVAANDRDPDGDPWVAQLVKGPSSGTLKFNADGSFTYTPSLGFTGSIRFDYRLSDGAAVSLPAAVTLNVTRPSDGPPPPVRVAANDGVYRHKVRVVWSRVEAASLVEYRLLRGTTADGAKQPISNWISATGFDDVTGIPGVTYYYAVQAALFAQRNQPGLASTVEEGWRALSPPEAVSASDGTDSSQVRISWSPAPAASYYRVFRAETPSGRKTRISDWISRTNWSDTSALPGVRYLYFVQSSVNDSGYHSSGYSLSDTGTRRATNTAEAAAPSGGRALLADLEEAVEISSIRVDTTGERVIAAYGTPGRAYTLLGSTDLSSWHPVETLEGSIVADSTVVEFTDPAREPAARFYRVVPASPID